MYDLVNNYRLSDGLIQLLRHAGLEESAQAKAVDICDTKYWSHDRPDGTPWQELVWNHYTGERIGENLAYGHTNDSSTLEAFIASPEHDRNLLGDWTDLGVWTHDCEGIPITVQHFGKRYTVQPTQAPVDNSIKPIITWSVFVIIVLVIYGIFLYNYVGKE